MNHMSNCHLSAPIILNYVLSLLLALFMIVVVLSFRKYLYHLLPENKEKALWLHRAVLLFYLFTIIYLLSSVPILLFSSCHPLSVPMVIIIEITDFAYFGHWLCMVCILFARLYYIFNNTVYRLSESAMNTFKTVMCLIMMNIPAALYFKVTSQTNIFGIILVIWIWFLSIYTVCFFIYKLRQLNRSMVQTDTRGDAELLLTITKCSILTSFSILFTLAFCILIIVSAATHNNYASLVMMTKYITVLDVFVNFLCIVLSFGFNNNWYMKCCRVCDIKCRILCQYKPANEQKTKNQQSVKDDSDQEENTTGVDSNQRHTVSSEDVVQNNEEAGDDRITVEVHAMTVS
eukprot:161011_1